MYLAYLCVIILLHFFYLCNFSVCMPFIKKNSLLNMSISGIYSSSNISRPQIFRPGCFPSAASSPVPCSGRGIAPR